MASEQQRLGEADRANLVAYLDGELTEHESQVLAAKLVHSTSGRREVEAFERTWELLDLLPRPKATPELTERTLTGVRALGSIDDKLIGVASRTLPTVMRLSIAAALAALLVASSYAATRWAWPDRSARLVRDGSIAEHLDEYREVGSLEFLQELDNDPSFSEGVR